MIQPTIHYGIHFLVPVIITFLFFRKQWKKALLIMLATMLVDLDHLLADPVFDPTRCSIGFHILHSYWAVFFYGIITFLKRTRIIGIGLLIHMIADGVDCLMML